MRELKKRELILIPLAFVSAHYIAVYLQFGAMPVVRLGVFALILLAGFAGRGAEAGFAGRGSEASFAGRGSEAGRGAKILTGVFSVLFTLCLLLGYHIHIENAYSGLMDKNYITPYTLRDVVAVICIFPGVWAMSLGLVWKCARRTPDARTGAAGRSAGPARQNTAAGAAAGASAGPAQQNTSAAISAGPARRKTILTSAAAMFAVWIPYLLIYWPGFLFADTLSNVQQALGMNVLDNHHPVLYTLFLRFCMWLGRTLGGGNTLGCGIYCFLQMIFLALAFSLMIVKVNELAGRKRFWLIVLWAVFALTPYIATYSIAMWKDPVFCAALMLLTLKLYDLTDRSARLGKGWWASAALLILITIFWRNNGIYIILFVDMALLLTLLAGRRRVPAVRSGAMAAVTSVILAAGFIITGPVYSALGIESPKVESYGMFFNQMARVAAAGGEMSDSDRAWMDEILDLELYPETYRPCCIDQLKWNENFNSEPLEHDFFAHWFSMLAKNPRIYFEAWELETCGFWTVNVPQVNQYARNIGGGSPRNFSEDYAPLLGSMDLHPANLLRADFWRDLFPFNEWGVPIGMIAWGVLLLAICMLVRGDRQNLLSLAPSAGLLITLIIASPIWYWPRYGAALQFLIPYFLVMFAGAGDDGI